MDRRQMVPDCLTGAIMAIEGIRDAVAVLNGPTGCKFYHSTMSEGQLHRDASLDPLHHAQEFYFGQARVPCTYMDDHDYIYGSREKLEAIVDRVMERKPSLIAVINSPGASLIGDDLELAVGGRRGSVPIITMETAGFSGNMAEGYRLASLKVLDRVPPFEASRTRGTVNLLGISIWHKDWAGSVSEISRMLRLCGVRVNAVIGAGWSVDEIRSSASSQCNLVLHEEFAEGLIDAYRKLGVPTYRPSTGAPIGFAALEAWVREACSFIGADPSPALEEISAMRRRAHREIARLSSMTGLPKGATFSVHAEASMMLPLTMFLHGHLGMVPVALDPYPFGGAGPMERLERYLATHGLEDVLGERVLDHRADVAFADGNTVAMLDARGAIACGMELYLPDPRLVRMTDPPLLGLGGTVRILERVLDALAYL